MKRPCPVCNEHPVVYVGAETCSYRCWRVFKGIQPVNQQPLFENQVSDTVPAEGQALESKEAKPRITQKAKREALAAISDLMHFRLMRDDNYEPSDSLLRLMTSLRVEISTAETKKG